MIAVIALAHALELVAGKMPNIPRASNPGILIVVDHRVPFRI